MGRARALQVIFRDGRPYEWLRTAKTGEVVRQRDVSAEAVREAFILAALSEPGNAGKLVAVVWPAAGGPPRAVDLPEFEGMMRTFGSGVPGAAALQVHEGAAAAGALLRPNRCA